MSSLDKQYWRGPEAFRGDGGLPPPDDDGLSRRRWLQLMGASLALAGAGGCRWEKSELLPFTKRPPGRTPGKTEKFATAMELGGSALGLLVTCVDGRPIKIEGNPKHPYSLGATNTYAQASILELYDPDRSKNLIEQTPEGEQVRTWDEFTAFAKKHFGDLRKTGGEGFAVLAEPSSSPTLWAMGKKLLEAFPKAKWHEYQPVTHDVETRRELYDLDRADVIVCIDADLFGTHPNAVRYAHDFAMCRPTVDGKLNRLYVVESCYTITGAMADHRLALRNDQIPAFLTALDDAVRSELPRQADGKASPKKSDKIVQPEGWHKFAHALAKDLVVHRKQCVLAVSSRQPEEVRYRVEELNKVLGAASRLMSLVPPESRGALKAGVSQLQELVADINGGRVRTLLILGGNPVYNAPADLDFSKALGKVNTAIHLNAYRDETSLHCAWHLPRTHTLESWGDSRAADGIYSVMQPMIEPLWGGKSSIEVLAMISQGEVHNGRVLVRSQFQQISISPDKKDAEDQWRKTLQDGIFPDSQYLSMLSDVDILYPARRESSRTDLDLELIFRPDSKLYDGRFANNGWLQEFPDPLTKITWDNAATMSLATAEKLGVKHEDVVKLKFKGREVEAPVYVMPGQADGTVAVTLGYGRTAAGKVGGSLSDDIAPVGFDAYKLRTTDAMWFGTGLTIEPTGKKHRFATTHDRYWIDKVGMEGRAERIGELVRETRVGSGQSAVGREEGREERGEGRETDKSKISNFKFQISNFKSPIPDSSAVSPHPNPLPKGEGTSGQSLWQEPTYPGRRWGMTIDLSKCVGCGACVVACQAENNIPVVGKERVLRGREMHWLRIDRYFEGDPATAKIVFQPLPCQQCEMAPCEQVCPVGATTHSKEGLNDMAYNRCIGVRYCANNCPFKVRRFNYFNYHKDLEDPANEVLKMVYNPEVTVRSRGVMEKCTYCVQRIQAAKIEAKNHRQATIPDGQIKTACQQVCPAQAIIFGDLNDRESEVAKQLQSPRTYQLLDELNLKPRTSYLTRVRNPNPELES